MEKIISHTPSGMIIVAVLNMLLDPQCPIKSLEIPVHPHWSAFDEYRSCRKFIRKIYWPYKVKVNQLYLHCGQILFWKPKGSVRHEETGLPNPSIPNHCDFQTLLWSLQVFLRVQLLRFVKWRHFETDLQYINYALLFQAFSSSFVI